MLDSVPSPRYSPVCNVLRQWKTSLISTYRVIESTDSMIRKRGKNTMIFTLHVFYAFTVVWHCITLARWEITGR